MLIKLALKGEAQPHQESAAKKLQKSPGLIIYHGLGSGKTFTSLLAGEKIPGSKLVVPPAALKGNYAKEINKFEAHHPDYHIVSLETFRKRPHDFIKKYKPNLLIADEVHRARNEGTASYEALSEARQHFPKFLGLTGSPISNDPGELANLVQLAAGKPVVGDAKHFTQHFVRDFEQRPGLLGRLVGIKPGLKREPKNLDELKARIGPYVHSFAGDAKYIKHVPSVSKELIHVPMDDSQKEYYDFVMGKLPWWSKYKIAHDLPPSKSEAAKLNAFLGAARQVSNSPASFGGPEVTPKIRRIVHDIESGLGEDPNFKSVTYSNFLESGLNPVAKRLSHKGIKYGLFTGEQSDQERDAAIKAFNSGKLRHLLVSPAGAEGLDLKGAKLMQIMDPHWNPEKTKQVIGRGARFKSHEHLPEAERKLLVREYLSEPPRSLWTKVKHFFSNKPIHQPGVDQYIYNRAEEKARLNEAFLNVLKDIK